MQPGFLIEAKNIPSDTSTTDIKAYFAKFGKVRHSDFSKPNEQKAIIRFFEAEHAKIAIDEMAEKKLEIRGNVIEGRLLEGEEEQKYWNEQIIPRLENALARGGRAGGRARGGKRDRSRGGGRGRRGRGGDGAKRRKLEHPPKE